MNRKLLIAILIIFLLIIVGVVIFWQVSHKEGNQSEQKLLQEVPGLPEEQWVRIITTRESGSGYRIATNKIDGYEISIPPNWQILETASVSSGFKAYYNTVPGGNDSAELTDGVMLTITVFDSIEEVKRFFPSPARFEDVETPAGRAYRSSYKATEDRFIKGGSKEVPIENSLIIKYIFPSEKKVYLASCLALGDNFSELASLCEKQILTFKILK